MLPLIVPAPHQSDQELAQQLTGLAKELGLDGSAIATDTSGPRIAYRVATALYDAWLVELGAVPVLLPPDAAQADALGAADAALTDSAGAGVQGSAAPAAATTTTKAKASSGKAAAK